MKNEVYGSIELDVSMDVDSDSSELGLLEGNYKVNNERFYKNPRLLLEDIKGNVIEINIHNMSVKWGKYFGENE